MKSLRPFSSLVGFVLPLSFCFLACGGEDDAPGSGADGTGAGGTGGGTGTGGAATGGAGTGGTGAGGTATGGAGTGGSPVTMMRVPGAENYNCNPPEGTPGALRLTQVGSGYTQPILVTHPPADPRLFVVEQEGVIKINGGGTFLDITDKAIGPGESNNQADERGLLGLAFHPDHAQNGLFYVYYIESSSNDSVLAEYTIGASADVADENSERVLLRFNQPHDNHNGGTIAFGADGYLYVALGDGGGADFQNYGGDPDRNGQNPSTMLGTILRIDPAAGGTYTSPAGNYPGALPEIWSIGLRNPYRMNFDGCTGDLYIGDVGQNVKEEIDVVEFTEAGKNFGWSTMEGTTCFNHDNFDDPLASCDQTGLTLPVLEYDNNGGAAVIGGAVYRGSAIPWLRGTYLYADNVQNFVYSTTYDRDTNAASAPQNLTGQLSPNFITAIQNGSDGEVYFVSALGSIFRLEAL